MTSGRQDENLFSFIPSHFVYYYMAYDHDYDDSCSVSLLQYVLITKKKWKTFMKILSRFIYASQITLWAAWLPGWVGWHHHRWWWPIPIDRNLSVIVIVLYANDISCIWKWADTTTPRLALHITIWNDQIYGVCNKFLRRRQFIFNVLPYSIGQ